MHHSYSANHRQHRSARGFTLIEVIVTVAILGILVAIALPSYTSYIARAHRADARGQLLLAAQFMQRFYAANDQFDKDRTGNDVINVINPTQSPADSTALYRLAIPSATLDSTKFTLQMAPVSDGKMVNDKCGTFTFTSTGVRGVLVNGTVDTTALRDECWK